MNKGYVKQIIGPIVDIEFKQGHLPSILNAIKIIIDDNKDLIVEVAQHIGDDMIRCISMGPTEGLYKGLEAIDLESPIKVPVGKETLGRIFNVLGEPIDGLDKEIFKTSKHLSIHREPPKFEDQNVNVEIFETGIKVIDLI